jgi:hypothetical protein
MIHTKPKRLSSFLRVGGFFLLLVLSSSLYGQKVNWNKPFQIGESITYEIKYNWGLIWLNAGTVNFSVNAGEHLGESVFQFDSFGSTYKKYDWVYKVRDTYQALADTSRLKPRRFKRDVIEGRTIYSEQVLFDLEKRKAFNFKTKAKKSLALDTVGLVDDVYDVLSMIYYARCIQWDTYKVGDKVPIRIFLDAEVHTTHITYLGNETIEVEGMGPVDCIVFKPQLIEGTIFPGGGDMTVWVTNDRNKIPVFIQTPIIVGNIKVNLIEAKGLKFP